MISLKECEKFGMIKRIGPSQMQAGEIVNFAGKFIDVIEGLI